MKVSHANAVAITSITTDVVRANLSVCLRCMVTNVCTGSRTGAGQSEGGDDALDQHPAVPRQHTAEAELAAQPLAAAGVTGGMRRAPEDVAFPAGARGVLRKRAAMNPNPGDLDGASPAERGHEPPPR